MREAQVKLGIDPFPGTFNVRLTSPTDRKLYRELKNYPGVRIDGFSDEKRTFGGANCYSAVIGDHIDYSTATTYPSIFSQELHSSILSIPPSVVGGCNHTLRNLLLVLALLNVFLLPHIVATHSVQIKAELML